MISLSVFSLFCFLSSADGNLFGMNWNKLWETVTESVYPQPPVNTPLQVPVYENGDSTNYQTILLTPADCANELSFLGAITSQWNHQKRPGKYFNEVALPINSCRYLSNESKLFFVDEGKLFIWPSFELGHRVIASSVTDPPNDNPVVLETLSTSPRVFRIYNFFTEEDSEALIANALKLTEEDYRLKRSSTGTNGYTLDDKRTSENAFDLSSPVALALKKRCFQLLGIHPYEETWADGLQILRYNQTTAYINHLDYIESDHPDHDWDSAGTGTNRFATIVLYLSDVEDGGETFFPQAKEWFDRDHEEYVQRNTCPTTGSDGEGSCLYPSLTPTRGKIAYPKNFTVAEEQQDTTSYLEAHNISHLFPQHSWQRRMVGHCRSKMAVKPLKAEAVLFYSQHPDGRLDPASLHGGCPVLQGSKWAANLWVWNGPRMPYLLQNRRRQAKKDRFSASLGSSQHQQVLHQQEEQEEMAPSPLDETSVQAIFENYDANGREMKLLWQGTEEMGSLVAGEALHMNSYVGHSFTVTTVDGQVVKEFVIQPKSTGGSSQRFIIGSSDSSP